MKSKTLTLLLSLVIALGLWMYVVTVISAFHESLSKSDAQSVTASFSSPRTAAKAYRFAAAMR